MIKQILILLFVPLLLSFSQSAEISDLYVKRSVSYSAMSPGEKSELVFTVLSGGDEKYQFARLIDYDEPFPVLKLFDNGSSALISSFNGRVELLDAKGNLNSELYLYKDTQPDYERSIYSSVSDDLIVLGVSAPSLEKCEILLIDYSGQFIRRFKVEGDNISGILLSKSKNLIAVSTYSWNNESLVEAIHIYSVDGEFISTIQSQFHSGEIVDDVLIGFTNNTFFVAGLSDLKEIVYGKASGGEIIHDIMLHENKVYLAVSDQPVLKDGEWLYKSARVDVMDKTLQNKTARDIQTNEFGSLSFSIKNGRLTVRTDDVLFYVE